MINRLYMYESLLEKMREKKLSLHQKARTLLKRTLRVTESLQVLRQILKMWVKHKAMYTRLCELGIEQTKPAFDQAKTQKLVEFFMPHAQKLYRLLNHSMKAKFLPLKVDETNVLLWDDKPMLETVRQDVKRLHFLLDGPCVFQSLWVDGTLH